MDFFKLVSDIERVDPEIYDRLDSRRRVFKHFGLAGKTLTAAMVPNLVSGIFQRAYGQTTPLPAEIVAVLNLALSLEYLEFYYYDSGLKAANLIPAADRPAFEIIRNDESGHIKVLREALGSAAIPDPGRTTFDYSGGKGTGTGPFAAAFGNYALYLGVAQSFVDTGVRAYKGGATKLMSNKDILEAALNIHSVEARHSSHVRTVRRGVAANAAAITVPGNPADLNKQPKSWISGTDNGGASPGTTPSTAAIYGPGAPATGGPTDLFFPADSNTMQAGIDLLTNTTDATSAAASEAFDEALDDATVKTIARNFVDAKSTLFV